MEKEEKDDRNKLHLEIEESRTKKAASLEALKKKKKRRRQVLWGVKNWVKIDLK